MEGDEVDPCECIMDNGFIMRRLLSMIRQTQSLCTDTECFVDSSSTQIASRNLDGSSDYFIVMTLFLGMYFFLHYWLTQSRRNSIQEPTKSSKHEPHNDAQGRPPMPPPPTC